MRILILGGNGFIGTHLTSALKDDHEVYVYGRSPNKFGVKFSGVKYIYGDFNDVELLRSSVAGKDIVFHLLSTTVPVTANSDPYFDIQSNLLGTIKLLGFIKDSAVQRLVYISSGGTVYGNPEYLPIDEKHPCNPIGSYGILKNTIENFIRMYSREGKFTYLIVRASNPYGPGQNFNGLQGVIAKILYKGIVQEQMTIWGDGSAVRDYLYIDDLINFLRIAGLDNQSGTFNVGSGEGKSIKEILDLLSGIMEKLPLLVFEENKRSFVERVVLDVSHATKIFGWIPRVSIDEGLTSHYNWMKSLEL